MSSNVEFVRSIYEDWERGDFSSAEWAHPDIEYAIADGPDRGNWTGLAAMRKAAGRMIEIWETVRIEGEQYREVDEERVLVLDRWSGRGKRSGLEFGHLRAHSAHLFHVRDGKVAALVAYGDRELALADLGLAPKVSAADRD